MIPRHLMSVEQMTEFFHAIRVKPVERSDWLIGGNIALDGRHQLIKGDVPGESVDGIGARYGSIPRMQKPAKRLA